MSLSASSEETSSKTTIHDIFDHGLLLITLYFDNYQDTYSLSLTCKQWNKIVIKYENIIYRNLLTYYDYNNSLSSQWHSCLLIFNDSNGPQNLRSKQIFQAQHLLTIKLPNKCNNCMSCCCERAYLLQKLLCPNQVSNEPNNNKYKFTEIKNYYHIKNIQSVRVKMQQNDKFIQTLKWWSNLCDHMSCCHNESGRSFWTKYAKLGYLNDENRIIWPFQSSLFVNQMCGGDWTQDSVIPLLTEYPYLIKFAEKWLSNHKENKSSFLQTEWCCCYSKNQQNILKWVEKVINITKTNKSIQL